MKLQLVAITRKNLGAVCKLDAGDGGKQVSPNVMSMAQAAVHGEAWPRAIEVDGALVGFLMLYDPSLIPDPEDADHYVWRPMVDKAHQGRGIGRAALLALIEHVRTRPAATELLISHVAHEPRLGKLYASVGFVPTGDTVDGETVMALKL